MKDYSFEALEEITQRHIQNTLTEALVENQEDCDKVLSFLIEKATRQLMLRNENRCAGVNNAISVARYLIEKVIKDRISEIAED